LGIYYRHTEIIINLALLTLIEVTL